MKSPFFNFYNNPVNSVVSQLKRSFLIINIAVVVFFIIYFFQAYFLFYSANYANQQVVHTNSIISNIKSIDADNEKIGSTAKDYLITRDKQFLNKLNAQIKDFEIDRNNLKLLIGNREQEQRNLLELYKLTEQKIALIQGYALHPAINNLEPPALATINNKIENVLNSLKADETKLLSERTVLNNTYSRSRVIFSLISYVLISIFLVIALYKINQNIKKRTAAEEKAHVNETKYKTLVEDSGLSMLIINRDGIIQFASKNVLQLTGKKPKDLLNIPVINYIIKDYWRRVIEVKNILSSSGNYNNTFELQISTSTNNKKWISCRIYPGNKEATNNEWQIVIWDIDEDKKLQAEIEEMENIQKEQQKLIQDIIDNIPSVIYIKDLLGKYILVNKKMQEVSGLPANQIIGFSDRQLIADKEKYLENKFADERVLEFKTFTTMEEVVEKEDKLHYFLVTKFPLFDDMGEVKNICGLATEITDRKESELKLLHAKKEAEKSKIAQETFLANMSHEIRTPMNGIIGMGNLLMSTQLNQEQKEFSENIQESARNLLAIINDILDFSKIKSGKFQFEHVPFKVRQVIRKAVYPLQFKAEEKRVKLNVMISPIVPEVLIGDQVRLQQIMINLVGNAIKFTSNGSVDVNVTVLVEKQDGNIDMQVEVKDTGIGISENKLEYIFESFTQNNLNTSRKYGGTGLGLAIVKQLVELQNGRVSVKSVLGKGSSFCFTIPYPVGQETKLITETNAPREVNLLEGIRILVAEDNIINQKVVKSTLERQGATVQLALNGQIAIDEISKDIYDVVLMDLQMPEVDGYKATRYVRHVMKKNIPIIAMTADALKGEAEKCYEAGMTGFISKPFEPDDLYNQILLAVKKQQANVIKTASKNATQDLVDMSFLYEISENDPGYICDVIDIFLSTMPEGLQKLEILVGDMDDWTAIYKQAHFLKSSVSVIRVKNMFEDLSQIEMLAKKETGKDEIVDILARALDTYDRAHPIIIQEKENNRRAQT